MSTARFFFWLVSLVLFSIGGYLLHPSLALLFPAGIILLQVIIGELHALYHSAITVPKRK